MCVVKKERTHTVYMATKKTAATEATAATTTEKTASTEYLYNLDTLQKHCRKVFGIPTAAFAGATATLDSTKKYTISEVKSIIEEWNKKEVK